MKRTIAALSLAAILSLASTVAAAAASPTQPNCLGQDVKGLAQDFSPWGQTIKGFGLTEGGLGTDVLGHLQGQEDLSSCPPDGFPSHTP
jgi:hypothetical protein